MFLVVTARFVWLYRKDDALLLKQKGIVGFPVAMARFVGLNRGDEAPETSDADVEPENIMPKGQLIGPNDLNNLEKYIP